MDCPKGTHYRKGYTTKKGTSVKPTCVKKRGTAKTKHEAPTECPKGKILRVEYTTKKGTKVRATCIKDVGKPGKGPKLWTVKPDGLRKFGYIIVTKDKGIVPNRTRHAALRRAVEGTPSKVSSSGRHLSGKTRIILRLSAIRNYIKNQPARKKQYDAMSNDIKYLQGLK
jgi:hypothetical protein